MNLGIGMVKTLGTNECGLKSKKIRNVFVPNGFCVVNDTIWFVHSLGNKVVNIDIHDFSILDIITLPEKEYDFRAIFDKVFCTGDTLIIALYGKRYIYSYSFKTKDLKRITDVFEKYPVYCNAIGLVGEKLFFLPGCGNPLIEYDCKNEQAIVKETDGFQEQLVAKSIEIYDGYIYGVHRFESAIYEYDIVQGKFNQFRIGKDIYAGIKRIQDYFVLPHENGVALWKRETGEIVELGKYPKEYRYDSKRMCMDVHRYGNRVYLFQDNAATALEVNMDSRSIEYAFTGDDFRKGEVYLDTIAFAGKIYACDSIEGCWHVFDLNKHTVEFREGTTIPNEMFNEMEKNMLLEMKQGDWYASELGQGYYDVENFVLLIRKYVGQSEQRDVKPIGKGIYDMVNSMR